GAVRPEGDAWAVADTATVALPGSVLRVVEERVERLGAGARESLAQAAVLGQEFSFPLLAALTGQGEDALLDLIERAVAARLLVDRSRPGEERFAFADDQVQEALYAGINPVRRRRYHLRAGQAIESLHA